MRREFLFALALAGCLTGAARLCAQAPAGSGQSKPAADAQKTAPATATPGTGSLSNGNPFPEDTNSVPVIPIKASVVPEGSYNGTESERVPLSGEDSDPVHSPDDPVPAAGGGQMEDSSSSLTGLDKLLPPPDDDQPDQKRKLKVKEPTHREAASKDIEVGGYYLEKKDWKAALSRFESAMVLDPENPEVYWGLAESERHLGQFADARAHYLKLLDYDPDGPHGKQARKAMKDPEVANGQNAAHGPSTVETAK
jgi:hypothetical protein